MLKLFFAGDICVNQKLTKSPIDKKLKKLIQDSDFAVATWEAPLIQENFAESIKAGPSLSQQQGWEYFAELFDCVSIANNHIMDYGEDGLRHTIKELGKWKLKSFGAGFGEEEVYRPCVIEKNNIKVALLGVGEAQFGIFKEDTQEAGYAWIFHNQVLKKINQLKQTNDFVIVIPHAGLEMEKLSLPEWRSAYQNFIDWGADMVIASHPHVIQGKEEYKGKWIYYSLGNFFFNMPIKKYPQEWFQSLGLSITLEKSSIIKIQEHFFRFDNQQLYLPEDTKLMVKEFQDISEIFQNRMLYLQDINMITDKFWHQIYQKYYAYKVTNNKYTKLPKIFQKIWNRISNRYLIEGNDLMLLHNIMIDTHRFVVERFIKNHYKIK